MLDLKDKKLIECSDLRRFCLKNEKEWNETLHVVWLISFNVFIILLTIVYKIFLKHYFAYDLLYGDDLFLFTS